MMGLRLPTLPLELDALALIEAMRARESGRLSHERRAEAARSKIIRQQQAPPSSELEEQSDQAEEPELPFAAPMTVAEPAASTNGATSRPGRLSTLRPLVCAETTPPTPANDLVGRPEAPRDNPLGLRIATALSRTGHQVELATNWLWREMAHGRSPRGHDLAGQQHEQRARRPIPRGIIVAAGATAVATLVVGMTMPGRVAELDALSARTFAVDLKYRDGADLGVVPQPDALSWSMADGDSRPIAVLRVQTAIRDFGTALDVLEGEHEMLGVSVPHLARAVVCYPFERIGFHDARLLGLFGGRCAGGSTPLMQLSRTLRRGRARSAFRKTSEVLDAVALAWHYPQGSDERIKLLSNGLHLGQAEGFPIQGIRAASLAAFGREPEQLQLHELAFLASLPKYPLRLSCEGLGDREHFEAQRRRARKALLTGFAGDRRQVSALRALADMSPILHPVPITGFLARGLSALDACRAGAHPLLRAELLDSSARLSVMKVLPEIVATAGERPSIIELPFSAEAQRSFKRMVDAGIRESATGDWTFEARGTAAQVLAFTTNADGTLASIYASRSDSGLETSQRLGSISKAVAILLLARSNAAPDLRLCDHAWAGRQNAGGDRGVSDCRLPHAMVPVTRVFGSSLNLPVNDVLRRRWSRQRIGKAAQTLGFKTGDDPAADIAFGTAQAEPRQAAALFAAMSRGVSAAIPAAVKPHVVLRYRTESGWHAPSQQTLDLSTYFAAPEAKVFTASVTRAPLIHGGTLAAAVDEAGRQEIGKSGTDDVTGSTRGKYAVGAERGRAWFAMAVATHGVLGDGRVSIIPLVRNVRRFALGNLSRRQTDGGKR